MSPRDHCYAGKFGAQPCLVVLPSFTVAGTVATDSGEASAELVKTEVGSRNNMCLGWTWQVGSGPTKRKVAWREAELHCGCLGEMLIELDYAILIEPEKFMASQSGAFACHLPFSVSEEF